METPHGNDVPSCGGAGQSPARWMRVLLVLAVLVAIVWVGVAQESPAVFFGGVLVVVLERTAAQMWRTMVEALTALVQPLGCRTCTA